MWCKRMDKSNSIDIGINSIDFWSESLLSLLKLLFNLIKKLKKLIGL